MLCTPKTQPTLQSTRLSLRPLKASDAGPITLYASDIRVAGMTTSIPHPLPPGDAESFIARSTAADAHEIVWAIEMGTEQLIGLISLDPIDAHTAEIGYWIGAAFWQTGFASEAVTTLLSYAASTQLTTVTANVFTQNQASHRVITKAGFTQTGPTELYSVANQANMPAIAYTLPLAQLSPDAAQGRAQR